MDDRATRPDPELPPRLYLVRHCQTTGQEPDAPLTPLGREQAACLADALADLGIRRIVSSPYLRARQSVEPLARRLGVPVETDDRLIERVLCGEPIPDWQDRLRASFDDLDLCLPGGESSRAAMDRGAAALREIEAAGPFPTAVVTHGNLLALLLRALDGQAGYDTWRTLTSPDVFPAARLPETGQSEAGQTGIRWSVRRLWPDRGQGAGDRGQRIGGASRWLARGSSSGRAAGTP